MRHEAPEELRGVLVDLAYEAGMTPGSVRSVVCRVLRRREDASNWTPFPNVDREVRDHVDGCEWYSVYDVAEALYRHLNSTHAWAASGEPAAVRFAAELNKYFRLRGIGWQLKEGLLEARGAEEFEQTLKSAQAELATTGRHTASNEIHEALRDLSRRPTPDVTGAIQHALAALECVARDVTGNPKATLGTILASNPGLVPAPLDQALEKLWGFTSEQGRHLREGRVPGYEEAEVAVQVAAAAARYLSKKFGASAS